MKKIILLTIMVLLVASAVSALPREICYPLIGGTICINNTGIVSGTPWNSISGFPAACPVGQFVTAIGGTLTCGVPTGNASTYFISKLGDEINNVNYNYTNVTTTYNGTFNVNNGIMRILDEASLVVYDTDGEAHLVDADLTRFDELRANTFTTPLTLSTFYNGSDLILNVSSTEGNRISVIVSNGTTSLSERFDYSEKNMTLISGTNETPVLNKIYIKIVSGVFTWFSTTSDPIGQHAMVARVLVGANGYVYSASLQEDSTNGFAKRVQRVNRKRGVLYEDGMNYNASATSIQIGPGSYINSIYDLSTQLVNSTTNGIFTVQSDGTYVTYDDFADLIANAEYSDGNSFGSNKYVNVIITKIPYDGSARLYATIQSKPLVEYTTIARAYSDISNTLKLYPNDNFLKLMSLPIARMIFNTNTGQAQVLPNGAYAEDYRGGVAGGVSSGGGIAEADPLSIHKDGSVQLTNNWNAGNFNITADYFKGNVISNTLEVSEQIIGSVQIQDLSGTYSGGSAYVCVYNNGTIYASETACP